tara:strand:- start:842 stop:2131 length:1290 start_codon:yes stop_codon:yes gene_type:complete
MADTLAEIHNSTLQESDFNSSGEATLLTTNGSTKHVIKNVQITEGDSNLPVNGTLNVSGMDVVALTGNSSGAEIVDVNTAIKVKTNTFPLRYQDDAFINRTNSSTFAAASFPKVNDVEGLASAAISTGNAIGHSIYSDNKIDGRLYMNLGSNNYNMFIQHNHSKSVSQLYLRQPDGTLVTSYTDSYMPWWFDDTQFAYRYDKNNNRIDKLDCFTGTRTTLKSFSANGSQSSYAHMSGVNDHNGNTKYLFFWTANARQFQYYDFSTDTARSFTGSSDGDNVFQYTPASGFFTPLMKTDGSIILICVRQTSRITYYNWQPDTNYTTTYETSTDRSLSSGAQLFTSQYQHFPVVKNRLYFIDYSSGGLHYYDADIDATETAYKDTGLTFSSIGSYGASINLSKITPSSSTISGRTYNISPSLKLRMTGVTST